MASALPTAQVTGEANETALPISQSRRRPNQSQRDHRLVDARDKALARIPLNTAFELSPESEGTGEGFVFGEGIGLCSGAGKGCGINGWTAGDGGTLKL